MNIFVEISLVLALAAFVASIMRMLKQPLIIGHIITGLIISSALLGFAPYKDTLEVFSNFGIVLLLFVVGIGLNPRIIKEVGKVSIITGISQIILTSVAGFSIVSLFGFNIITSIYIAIALAFSSTIIVIKLLTDKKDQTKLYGKIAIGLLLVQDIVATFALLVASASNNGGLSWQNIIMLVIKGAALSVGIYLFVKFVLRKLTKFLSRSNEMLFLFAIAWGFGIAAIAYTFGFSLEVGALFAGVSLASMPYAQEVASRLRPLRDFFIVIFFIYLGSKLNIGQIGDIIWPAIVISAFVIIIKPIVIMIGMNILGYTKKNSFKSGFMLAQISEFSIIFILLGQKNGQIPAEAVYLITLVGLLTIAASTYMTSYINKIYDFLAKRIPLLKDNKQLENEHSSNYKAILFGYEKGGHDFLHLFKDLKQRYIVVDYNPDTIENLERHNITHVYGDAQDIELLEEIGIDRCKIMVSTITEFDTNLFLVRQLAKTNPNAICIVYADNIAQVEQLYADGASYVMTPHLIGSEQIGSYIKKIGLNKDEFQHMREKHLEKLRCQIL